MVILITMLLLAQSCFYNYRYSSRSLIIPFKTPTIGPRNKQEMQYFHQLSEVTKSISSSIGWAIGLGKLLQERQQFEGTLLEKVRTRLPGVDPRLCTAYCTLVFCVSKVNISTSHDQVLHNFNLLSSFMKLEKDH